MQYWAVLTGRHGSVDGVPPGGTRRTSVGGVGQTAHVRLEIADPEAGETLDLDPAEAIATRTVPGGAAPAPMDAMLTQCRSEIAAARERTARARTALADAETALLQVAGSRSSVS